MKCDKVALQTCTIDNYGGILQGYALKRTIEKLGYKCDVLPFERYEDLMWKTNVKQLIKQPIYFFVNKQAYYSHKSAMRKKRKFEHFRRVYLGIKGPYTRNKIVYRLFGKRYKYYVCGSDLIWNPLLRKENLWYDMLGFVQGQSQKIAYAPSIGIPEIPDDCKEEFFDYIKEFSYLSCREDEGVELIQKTYGLSALHVLDPTLLVSRKTWSKISEVKYIKPYCYIYMFDQEPIDTIINKILKESDWDIRIIPYNNISDERLKTNKRVHFEEENCGPLEFISLIANAEMVISNSFHGMAFSINFNVPFLIFQRENSSAKLIDSRLRSLSRLFGVQDRVLNRNIDIAALDLKKCLNINWLDINQILKRERKKSINYLKKALLNE